MRTYEDEYKELVAWMRIKNKEYTKKIKNDTEPTQGYDGESTYERQQVVWEYNRRLDELKKKYGKDKVAATQDSEPAEPVTKSRKFGQVIQPV